MEEGCRIYRCAVIGQAPMRFPWGFDEEDSGCRKMKIELAQQVMALRQRGVTQFLTACDCGVGLYAAEIVNGLRETADQDLMLFCYTPHEEQATKWAPYLRERYFTTVAMEDGSSKTYTVTVYVDKGTLADQFWDKLTDFATQVPWWQYAEKQQSTSKYPKYW